MLRQSADVLTTNELLHKLRDRGIRNAEIARALDLGESGIVELYAGKRSLKLDEAARLVELFGLESNVSDTRSQPLTDKVAANIQRQREVRQLSRPQLAQRCRPPTSPQQIEKLEKGERRLSLDWVQRVAIGLNIDVVQLIAGNSPDPGRLSDEVAREVARALGLMTLAGEQLDETAVEEIASFLQGLSALFAQYPETRHSLHVARPAIDLLTRRSAKRAP